MSKGIDEAILDDFLEETDIDEIKLRKVDCDVSSACLGGVPTLTCNHCGHIGEPELVWQTCDNGCVHLRANCSECGEWIMYMKQAVALKGAL